MSWGFNSVKAIENSKHSEQHVSRQILQKISRRSNFKTVKPGKASKTRNVTRASETFELEVWEEGVGGAWLF